MNFGPLGSQELRRSRAVGCSDSVSLVMEDWIISADLPGPG